MYKDLKEIAQTAYKIGQIRGMAFVIETYIKRAIEQNDDMLDGSPQEVKGYLEDALAEIKRLRKVAGEI